MIIDEMLARLPADEAASARAALARGLYVHVNDACTRVHVTNIGAWSPEGYTLAVSPSVKFMEHDRDY